MTFDATNFSNIRQSDHKFILNDNNDNFTGNGFLSILQSSEGNSFPIVEYPIRAEDVDKYNIWIRCKSNSENTSIYETFSGSIFLDNIKVFDFNDSVSTDWSWTKNSIILPDTQLHTLGIRFNNLNQDIDKIYITTDDSSASVPINKGPDLNDSPFITVHMQVYKVDDNLSFGSAFDIYDFKNSIDEVIQDDWYNFNINVLNNGTVDYTEKAALVLSSSGVTKNNFILWEMVYNDEYLDTPSAIKS